MTLKEMKFDLRSYLTHTDVYFDNFKVNPKCLVQSSHLGVKQIERWTRHHHYSIVFVHSVQKLHKTLHCQCQQLHNLTRTDLSHCPSHLFQR